MVVILGRLAVAPEQAAALDRLVLQLVDGTHAEEGCVSYEFSRDLHDPARFHIVEEWLSDEALAEHVRSDHYQAFKHALAGLRVTERSIVRHVSDDRTVLA